MKNNVHIQLTIPSLAAWLGLLVFASTAQASPTSVMSGGGGGSYSNAPGGIGTSAGDIAKRDGMKNTGGWQIYGPAAQREPMTGNLSEGGSKATEINPNSSGPQTEPGSTQGPPGERLNLPQSLFSVTPQDGAQAGTFKQSSQQMQITGGNWPVTAQEDLAVATQQAVQLPALLQSPANVQAAIAPLTQAIPSSINQSIAGALKGEEEGEGGEGGGDEGGGGEGGGGGGGGSSATGTMGAALAAIMGMPTPGLINVANTSASTGIGMSLLPFKTIPQAVGMVQAMYKNFFIPFAILLLLPGAVMTQAKAQITASFNLKADDASSPFEGILRSVVAIFLIPATQLIVSYSIDVGNSLSYSVSPMANVLPILAWLKQVAYSAPAANSANAMLPPTQGGLAGESPTTGDAGGVSGGSGGDSSSASNAAGAAGGMGGGIAADEDSNEDVPEAESAQSTTLELMFNAMMFMLSTGLLVMTAFQLVIMCYLYLLGPIAAAFYAWPAVQGKLFRSVFGNWANAVITVSLWRFYWMVILTIMTTRAANFGEANRLFNLQWEMAVMTCLIGLMFYIPMNPWNFNPGMAFRYSKSYGESIMQMVGQQGGGAAGGGGGGGGGEQSASRGGGSQSTGGGEQQAASAQSSRGGSQTAMSSPSGGQQSSNPPTSSGSQGDSNQQSQQAMQPAYAFSSAPSSSNNPNQGQGENRSQPANSNAPSLASNTPDQSQSSSPYGGFNNNPPTSSAPTGQSGQSSTSPSGNQMPPANLVANNSGQNNSFNTNSSGPPIPLNPNNSFTTPNTSTDNQSLEPPPSKSLV